MRALAEAVLELAEEVREELVGERLLPEARSSAPLAAVVRQMDIDQICRMFASRATGRRTAHRDGAGDSQPECGVGRRPR